MSLEEYWVRCSASGKLFHQNKSVVKVMVMLMKYPLLLLILQHWCG